MKKAGDNMEESVSKQIEMRRQAIDDNYTVPVQAQAAVEQFFADMAQLGEDCADAGEFEARFAASPLNQQYLDIFPQLKVKSSVITQGIKAGAEARAADKELLAQDIKEEAEYMLRDIGVQLRRPVMNELRDRARDIPGVGEAVTAGRTVGMLKRLFGKNKD